MASLCWPCNQRISLKVDQPWKAMQLFPCLAIEGRSFTGTSAELFGRRVAKRGSMPGNERSFVGGSRVVLKPKVARSVSYQKASTISASWITSSEIASNAFDLGTTAILPFYALMVLAPKAEVTKRIMESSIPNVVLGVMYAYLLYLSWTPDTISMLFTSKYWLPELPGIAKMFSNEMTLASAWLHLLAGDLFAARQVYHDGLKNKIETRHSVSLCMICCPIGIVTHVITKVLTKRANEKK